LDIFLSGLVSDAMRGYAPISAVALAARTRDKGRRTRALELGGREVLIIVSGISKVCGLEG
jgi:hypothetical protein